MIEFLSTYLVNAIFLVLTLLELAVCRNLYSQRDDWPLKAPMLHFFISLSLCTGYWVLGYPPGLVWTFWGGVITLTPVAVTLALLYRKVLQLPKP